MSDHSEQLSGGSSLSLFSGLGTSSVSGASEATGGVGAAHVNVEELSDSRLEAAVEEVRTSLRLLVLETLMFESYHERLQAGQVALAAPSDKDGSGSRKGSGTMFSDSTSETDSQPPTAGTSLLGMGRAGNQMQSCNHNLFQM